MKDLHVSWEEYRRLIETLAFNVYDSGWKFDSLLSSRRPSPRRHPLQNFRYAAEHFVNQFL